MSVAKQSYASNASMRRAIGAAMKAGIVIGNVRLHPDGVIELQALAQSTPAATNDFDRLEAAGCL